MSGKCNLKVIIKAVTRVSFLVRQGFRLNLKLQGNFGYETDRTHVIKVVVSEVKIAILLTYGIYGFKKKEVT